MTERASRADRTTLRRAGLQAPSRKRQCARGRRCRPNSCALAAFRQRVSGERHPLRRRRARSAALAASLRALGSAKRSRRLGRRRRSRSWWHSDSAAAGRRVIARLPEERGKSSEHSRWRLLDHQSDSAAALAARHESRDRQAPSWPEVGAGVAPECMPKRNSGPIRRRGPMGDDAALSRLATGETRCPVRSSDLLWRCRARSGLPRSE